MYPELKKEIETYERRTPKSRRALDQSWPLMPLGVSSNFRSYEPYPLFISDANGTHIRDLDGNEYVDFALCFGALMAGHCNPVVMKAVQERLEKGTMFGMPHEMERELAEEIIKRYPVPEGETMASFLHHRAMEGARERYRPLDERVRRQMERELALIEKLDLAGYFLIVWDLVRFCRENGILVQGRGSAANSAVCYALGITAVDPIKMELLFERFLSEERGEWPDIDLDLPSDTQRERVIQYVYKRYGEAGAAMTANEIGRAHV